MFRRFCLNSSTSTFIRFYITLIRPILEYCAVIWDPSSPSLSHSLESVQHFAIKLASKFHPSLVASIHSDFKLSSLTTHRQHAKLIFLFKLFHNRSFFPLQIIQPCRPSSSYPFCYFHPNNLICPHSKKSSFKKYFIPSTILLWNSLAPTPSERNQFPFPFLFPRQQTCLLIINPIILEIILLIHSFLLHSSLLTTIITLQSLLSACCS